MNKVSFLTLFLIIYVLTSRLGAQPITRKVLFLGNSYTSVNNLPQITANAALSVGDSLIFDSNLPGGYKLVQHYTDINSTNKVIAGGWDYVVLQEQSETPALQNGNFSAGAQQLCNLIKQHNPCAQPLFYMTWGRKNGDALNCPLFPLMCTYNGMDSLTRVSYTMVAEANNAEVSPVGAVWKYIRQNHPNLNFYQADESHPNAEGSYAAACCFYTAIFKKSPLLISYNYSISPSDAAIIRNAVKVVFFDHLSDWDFKVSPTANFNYTIGSGFNEAIFNYLPSYPGVGGYANTFFWDFGDGSNTTLINPGYLSTISHNYLTNGTYTVTLVVSNCNVSGTQQAVFQNTVSFCNHSPTILKTYSWTCVGSETVSTQVYTSYQWYANGTIVPGQIGQHFPLNPLISKVSVMATQNGCSEMSQEYTILNDPQISLNDVTVKGDFIQPGIVCKSNTVELTVTALNGAETIQWSKDGTPIPTSNSDTLLVSSSGTYAVSLFYPNCPANILYTKQLSFTFVDCNTPPGTTGIEGSAMHSSVVIYPNPTSRFITITSSGKINAVEVYNLIGEKLCRIPFSQNKMTDTIDLSIYPSGVYFIKLYEANYSFTKKVVLQTN